MDKLFLNELMLADDNCIIYESEEKLQKHIGHIMMWEIQYENQHI